MRKSFVLFFVLAFAGSVFSIDLTISPTNMAWTEQGWLDVSVTNFTEEGVDIKLYVDVNGDGVVNGSDFLAAAFEIDDGMSNPFGAETFVDDKDGLTNQAIETAISFYGVAYSYAHTIGDYIIQAVEIDDDDVGVATTTVPFSVTQPTSTVWITGSVYDIPSSNAVAGARVEMEVFSDSMGVVPAAWADENGEFILYLPDGVSTSDVAGVFASAKGFLSAEENPDTEEFVSFYPFTNTLVIGENALEDPLLVVSATEEYDLYEVSGKIYWVEGEPPETNAISGVLVEVEGEGDDDDELLSWDVTDEDGSFTLVFPGDPEGVEAEIFCENPLLILRGIVGTFSEVTVTGAMSGLEIVCYSAEALARATVTDKDTGAPVVGAEVFFESEDEIGDAYTLSNGVYEIGLLAGTYTAEVDDESLGYQHYVRPDWQSGLVVSNGIVFTNAPFEVERGYIISGTVCDTNRVPLSDGAVVLMKKHNMWTEWFGDVDVTPQGDYSLLSPTGTFYVCTDDFGDYIVDMYYTNTFKGNIDEATPVVVTTNGVTDIDFYLPTGGRVEGVVFGSDNNPVDWNEVRAYRQNATGAWECVGLGNIWGGGGEFGFAVPPGTSVTLRTMIDYGAWYPRTWYGNTCSRDLATTFSVTTEQTESNLDIQLFPGYEVHGQVWNQAGGAAITNVAVTAFDASSNQYDSALTTGGGWYNNLCVPTNVALVFYADASGFEGEFYSNVYNFADATEIQSTSHQNLGVDFVLYATGADSDDDGIPDSEEDTVPDGVYSNGVDYADYEDSDTDDDGVDDGDEQFAGTDPQDGDDLFSIVETDSDAEGLFLLWSSVSGRTYYVQETTNLVSGIWSNIYTIEATAENTEYTNAALIGQGFYRVQVSEE